ncbi:hypothetical protein CDL62_16600 [Alkalitalea saponilacus]|nr:hypothetical protein CDL62_16600 [Alkalitalea saponilacus]
MNPPGFTFFLSIQNVINIINFARICCVPIINYSQNIKLQHFRPFQIQGTPTDLSIEKNNYSQVIPSRSSLEVTYFKFYRNIP